MLDNVLTERVVLVQATVEDGPPGLVYQLTQARKAQPGRVFRGIILLAEPGLDQGLLDPGPELDRLHEAGVRGVRVHGYHGGSGEDVKWAHSQLLRAASLYPVKNLGWTVSAQFSLATWACLADRLLASERGDDGGGDLATAKILADHNALAASKDLGDPDLEAVVSLLRQSSRFFVKLGAFYRREPLDISQMRQVVKLFASAAPDRLVWGSDWPHVDATRKGLDPTPHLGGINAADELRALESWLSAEAFHRVMVQNPGRVFG
jgi:predicted TIM-barrel fold metal-dependent hydrolase